MSIIQPCGNEAQSVSPWQAMAAQPLASPLASGVEGAANLSETASAQSVSFQSSMTRVSQVQQEVGAFLGTLGGNLQDNELLRMMIGLLILNALLNQDSGPSRGQQATGALELLGAMAGRQEVMSYQSTYTAVQIDFQQSSYAQSSDSVQPSAAPAADGPDPRLDLSA